MGRGSTANQHNGYLMKTYSVNAFHLTDKLKLKEIGPLIEVSPLLLSIWEAVFKLSEDSYVFLYNFGSVVFFNVGEERQKIILDKVKRATATTDQISYTTTDTFSVEVTSEAKTEAGFNKA